MLSSIGMDIPSFYPTPPSLAKRMAEKVQDSYSIRRVLDPSAGKGDLLDFLKKAESNEPDDPDDSDDEFRFQRRRYWNLLPERCEYFAIEIDEDLQAILRARGQCVIDSDFLSFTGPDKFDLIMMNPPFDAGDKHLLKAIDIMYCGQIVCLLNAETLKNPYTRTRQELVKKLDELGAEIEYIKDAFAGEDAQRSTDVEVAMVNIVIERRVEEDLFAGADDKVEDIDVEVEEKYELITDRKIETMVAEYKELVRIATETILKFYENKRKIGGYLQLKVSTDPEYRASYSPESKEGKSELTKTVQNAINEVAVNARKAFWRSAMNLPEVTRRLTKEKADQFHNQIESRSTMDFTEHNIRAFVLNIINGYQQTLSDAVVKLFDRFSCMHAWRDTPEEKNVHYYNGWKTNDAFKINKKVIIPVGCSYSEGGPFRGYHGWELQWGAKDDLRDIDIVLNYFDGMDSHYFGVIYALEQAFSRGCSETSSTYFSKIIAYKKGTLHLTFRDEDILRRFNIEAAKGKAWLPRDYGAKPYDALSIEYKGLVDSFEGRESYVENQGRIGFTCPRMQPMIEAPKTGQVMLFDEDEEETA